MRINFKLRKGKKINTILLDLRHGREIRIRYSTNITIKKGSERYWEQRRCRIKTPNDIHDYELINIQLRNYEVSIEKTISHLEKNGRLSQGNLEKLIKDLFDNDSKEKPQENKKSNTVLDYFDWYINFHSKNKSQFTNKPLNSGTLRTYKNCRNYFSNYLKSREIEKFLFEDVDKDFYYDFINYGYENKYTLNYIGSMIQKLKTIISSAFENEIHKNKEHTKRYFSKLVEEINHPYLSDNELKLIQNVNLENELENDVRDIFLLASYTGLRVGDLNSFLENPIIKVFDEKPFIHLKQKKTGGEVYIPLNSVVNEILNKRNGKFPPKIHPNKINKLIKSIARKAKINDEFTIERTVCGEKIQETKPKYRFITVHSARRSFCTNAYNAGIPPHQIMVISGHKSEKVFYNYIKASVKRKALQISEHSFFN